MCRSAIRDACATSVTLPPFIAQHDHGQCWPCRKPKAVSALVRLANDAKSGTCQSTRRELNQQKGVIRWNDHCWLVCRQPSAPNIGSMAETTRLIVRARIMVLSVTRRKWSLVIESRLDTSRMQYATGEIFQMSNGPRSYPSTQPHPLHVEYRISNSGVAG